jgi:hypothetical protein
MYLQWSVALVSMSYLFYGERLAAGRVPQVQQDVGRGQEEVYRGRHRVRRQDRLQGDILFTVDQ